MLDTRETRRKGMGGWHYSSDGTFDLDGMTLTLNAGKGDTGWKGHIGFVPTRHRINQGERACPVHDLPTVLTDVVDHLTITGMMQPRCDLAAAQVRRIDVARDFHLTPPYRRAYLTATNTSHVPGARKRMLYTDAHGHPRSTYVGNTTGGLVKAYDHGHAHHHPEDVLRVEVEARTWAKTFGGINTVEDIKTSTVTKLFVDRFAWARFDQPVVYADDWLDRAYTTSIDAPAITPRKLIGWVGRKVLTDRGFVLPEASATTQAEHRRLQWRIGVIHNEDPLKTFRLDPAVDGPIIEPAGGTR